MTNPIVNTVIIAGMVLVYLIPAGIAMARDSLRRQEDWRKYHG